MFMQPSMLVIHQYIQQILQHLTQIIYLFYIYFAALIVSNT